MSFGRAAGWWLSWWRRDAQRRLSTWRSAGRCALVALSELACFTWRAAPDFALNRLRDAALTRSAVCSRLFEAGAEVAALQTPLDVTYCLSARPVSGGALACELHDCWVRAPRRRPSTRPYADTCTALYHMTRRACGELNHG